MLDRLIADESAPKVINNELLERAPCQHQAGKLLELNLLIITRQELAPQGLWRMPHGVEELAAGLKDRRDISGRP